MMMFNLSREVVRLFGEGGSEESYQPNRALRRQIFAFRCGDKPMIKVQFMREEESWRRFVLRRAAREEISGFLSFVSIDGTDCSRKMQKRGGPVRSAPLGRPQSELPTPKRCESAGSDQP